MVWRGKKAADGSCYDVVDIDPGPALPARAGHAVNADPGGGRRRNVDRELPQERPTVRDRLPRRVVGRLRGRRERHDPVPVIAVSLRPGRNDLRRDGPPVPRSRRDRAAGRRRQYGRRPRRRGGGHVGRRCHAGPALHGGPRHRSAHGRDHGLRRARRTAAGAGPDGLSCRGRHDERPTSTTPDPPARRRRPLPGLGRAVGRRWVRRPDALVGQRWAQRSRSNRARSSASPRPTSRATGWPTRRCSWPVLPDRRRSRVRRRRRPRRPPAHSRLPRRRRPDGRDRSADRDDRGDRRPTADRAHRDRAHGDRPANPCGVGQPVGARGHRFEPRAGVDDLERPVRASTARPSSPATSTRAVGPTSSSRSTWPDRRPERRASATSSSAPGRRRVACPRPGSTCPTSPRRPREP